MWMCQTRRYFVIALAGLPKLAGTRVAIPGLRPCVAALRIRMCESNVNLCFNAQLASAL
jgi:hypothetical protein